MSGKPRVVCVGANLESEVALNRLFSIKANVVGLVTRPAEMPGNISDYVDLHDLCHQYRIATIDTVDINSDKTIAAIADLAPDYIFTLGWSQLFKSSLLQLPKQYVVGSHPSPLPRGRGRAPIPWTILQGEKKSAVSLFRMDSGVDSGPILCQRWFDVPPSVYAVDLYRLVADNLGEAFCQLYQSICDSQISETPQDISQATFRSKRTPADGHVDFTRTSVSIDRLVRAVCEPYPGAYTYYRGTIVRIWRTSLEDVPAYYGQQGQILARSDDRLLVQTGDHPLWLWQFTDEERQPVSVRDFRIGSKMGFSLEDEVYALRKEVAALQRQLQMISS